MKEGNLPTSSYNGVGFSRDTILEAQGERLTDIQVTMINAENAFIIRLEDGRFIVIDGGSYTNWGEVRDTRQKFANSLSLRADTTAEDLLQFRKFEMLE